MKILKFIKITTKTTEETIVNAFGTLPTVEVDYIAKLYSKFECVEFFDKDNFACMYAIIHENYIGDLLDLYARLSITFEFQDLSKQVLFSQYEFDRETAVDLANLYLDTNLDTDTVLDKMLECGSNSLNQKDISVLERH